MGACCSSGLEERLLGVTEAAQKSDAEKKLKIDELEQALTAAEQRARDAEKKLKELEGTGTGHQSKHQSRIGEIIDIPPAPVFGEAVPMKVEARNPADNGKSSAPSDPKPKGGDTAPFDDQAEAKITALEKEKKEAEAKIAALEKEKKEAEEKIKALERGNKEKIELLEKEKKEVEAKILELEAENADLRKQLESVTKPMPKPAPMPAPKTTKNINAKNVTIEDLTAIHGIGPARGGTIMSARPFRPGNLYSQLTALHGIGPGTAGAVVEKFHA